MSDADSYFTIEKATSVEIKVKGSRFIARTVRVTSADEAGQFLDKIRHLEHAATHNCYAWRIGRPGRIEFKYSDDGEPSGTAGKPIFQTLVSSDLSDIGLVVTRYFGGTKLGTGGLSRAYAEAAGRAVDNSGKKEILIVDRITVHIEFSLYDQFLKLLHSYKVYDSKADFSDRIKVSFEIRKSQTEKLIEEIINLSGGRAEIEKEESDRKS